MSEERLWKTIDYLEEEVIRLQKALEQFLVVLAGVSIFDTPVKRLSYLISSMKFPKEITKRIIDYYIRIAKTSNMSFDQLAEALVNGCGKNAKILVSLETITEVYGSNAAYKWKEMIRSSNPSIRQP